MQITFSHYGSGSPNAVGLLTEEELLTLYPDFKQRSVNEIPSYVQITGSWVNEIQFKPINLKIEDKVVKKPWIPGTIVKLHKYGGVVTNRLRMISFAIKKFDIPLTELSNVYEWTAVVDKKGRKLSFNSKTKQLKRSVQLKKSLLLFPPLRSFSDAEQCAAQLNLFLKTHPEIQCSLDDNKLILVKTSS